MKCPFVQYQLKIINLIYNISPTNYYFQQKIMIDQKQKIPRTTKPIFPHSNQNNSHSSNNLSPSITKSQQSSNSAPMTHKHDNKNKYQDQNKNIPHISITYIIAILAILVVSFLFIYEFLIITKQNLQILIIVIFSLIFFMVVWSFFATSCSDPGKVPFYYGLSSEINKKNTFRKYCIVCQNFKPQRTHHCSVCKKCILNMDHHCPWVNNCIGFKNRKFFILFLIYISIGLFFTSIVQLFTLINQLKKVIQTQITDIHFGLKLLTFIITITFSVALIVFLSHHLIMLKKNTTSLQQFSRSNQHSNKQNGPILDQAHVDYNVGNVQNILQVFGENKMLWPFPVYGNGPKGNGTCWPKSKFQNVLNG